MAAEVWFHCSVKGVPISLLSPWRLVSRNPETLSAMWEPKNVPSLFLTSDILGVCMCKRFAEGPAITIQPAHRR